MADTQANRRSGGARFYFALPTTSLPVLTGNSLDFDNDEVQTLSDSGTVSGGTFTLSFTHPTTAIEETTASLNYDATAGEIQSALIALNGIGASDVVCTGGPSPSDVTITFGGNLANTPISAMVVDNTSITGGGTMVITRTTPGRLWTEFPSVTNDPTLDGDEVWENFVPTYPGVATESDFVNASLKPVTFEFKETNRAGLMRLMASTLTTQVAAGASTAGYTYSNMPSQSSDFTSFQLLAVYDGPVAGGWGTVKWFPYCQRQSLPAIKTKKNAIRTMEMKIGVFADRTGSKIPAGTYCRIYEYDQAQTGA